MKVYTKIVIDLNGNVIYEESYEYRGAVSQCKGGALRAQREASESAKKSYTLQKEMQDFQLEQTQKLEQGKSSAEATKASALLRQLEVGRKGRASTITTIEKKPSFADFRAKYESENPLSEGTSQDEYNRLMKEEFAKVLPFNRLIKGEPALKKAALYA